MNVIMNFDVIHLNIVQRVMKSTPVVYIIWGRTVIFGSHNVHSYFKNIYMQKSQATFWFTNYERREKFIVRPKKKCEV